MQIIKWPLKIGILTDSKRRIRGTLDHCFLYTYSHLSASAFTHPRLTVCNIQLAVYIQPISPTALRSQFEERAKISHLHIAMSKQQLQRNSLFLIRMHRGCLPGQRLQSCSEEMCHTSYQDFIKQQQYKQDFTSRKPL